MSETEIIYILKRHADPNSILIRGELGIKDTGSHKTLIYKDMDGNTHDLCSDTMKVRAIEKLLTAYISHKLSHRHV